MLQAHSLLWHYLWVAPNVLLFVLAFVLWKRGLAKRFRVLFVFAILSAVSELAVYLADVTPWVTPKLFWRIDWASVLIEGTLKFVLIGEIFAQVFGSYGSLARLGKLLIRAIGVVLVLTAAVAAAYAPQDSLFGIVSGAHLLEQTTYLIECWTTRLHFPICSVLPAKTCTSCFRHRSRSCNFRLRSPCDLGDRGERGAAAFPTRHSRFPEHGHLPRQRPGLVLLRTRSWARPCARRHATA